MQLKLTVLLVWVASATMLRTLCTAPPSVLLSSTSYFSLLPRRSSFSLLSHMSSPRGDTNHLSLDSNLLAENPDLVKSHLISRKTNCSVLDDVDSIAALLDKRNKLISEGDVARSERKTLSQQIGKLMKEGDSDQAEELKRKVEDCSCMAASCDDELVQVSEKMNKIMSEIPNLLDDRVPEGKDDGDNEIVFIWKEESRKVGSGYKWHDELALMHNGINVDAATKISGARFSVLTGQIARLERALKQYFMDFHTERDYTEVSVPYIVSRSTLEGTGQLPKFEDDLFKVDHKFGLEDGFLIPTAEVPVTNIFRESIIDEIDLPIRMVCQSPAFRAEAGSYGRDTRGKCIK